MLCCLLPSSASLLLLKRPLSSCRRQTRSRPELMPHIAIVRLLSFLLSQPLPLAQPPYRPLLSISPRLQVPPLACCRGRHYLPTPSRPQMELCVQLRRFASARRQIKYPKSCNSRKRITLSSFFAKQRRHKVSLSPVAPRMFKINYPMFSVTSTLVFSVLYR